MTALPARGELWWCELHGVGRRPAVVLTRDAAIPRLGRMLHDDDRTLPSEVVLEPAEDPVPRRSAVDLDSIESVPVAVLVERLGPAGRRADSRSLFGAGGGGGLRRGLTGPAGWGARPIRPFALSPRGNGGAREARRRLPYPLDPKSVV